MIYQKVVDYCNEKNISIFEFEQINGLGNGTVGKWKDGKYNPRIETLKKISRIIGVAVEELIEEEE